MTHLPGYQHKESAAYAVSNLGSLFTVCALALNDAEDWSEEIRKRVTQDIKHVLELGAVLAIDAGSLIEGEIATRAALISEGRE